MEKFKESALGKFLNKPGIKHFLNNFELDLCVWLFIVMTILQSIQVISRYLLSYSFVWAEELAMIMFIWMGWLSISAAVTHRKHMSITVLVDALPKKVQRVMKIISNLVFIVFCISFLGPSVQMVLKLANGPGVTALLRIPKWIPYLIIPVMLAITVIRLIQDAFRLATEDEKVMGKAKSSMDFDAYERDWEEAKAKKIAAKAEEKKGE